MNPPLRRPQISPKNGRHVVTTRATLESFPASERRAVSLTTLWAKASATSFCISMTDSACN